MSEKFTSQNYEEELKAEEESAQERIEEGILEEDQGKIEEAALTLSIIEGVREGLKEAGFSSKDLAVIDQESAKDNSKVTAGLFDRQNNRIGMAAVQDMKEVIDTSASDIVDETKEHVEAILEHEERHQDSWENAQIRGEEGLVSNFLGEEADEALQELMASQGTERFDTYDQERGKAATIIHQIGLNRSDVIRLIHEGQEAEVVKAGIESGYVEVDEEKRKIAA